MWNQSRQLTHIRSCIHGVISFLLSYLYSSYNTYINGHHNSIITTGRPLSYPQSSAELSVNPLLGQNMNCPVNDLPKNTDLRDTLGNTLGNTLGLSFANCDHPSDALPLKNHLSSFQPLCSQSHSLVCKIHYSILFFSGAARLPAWVFTLHHASFT